MSDFYLSVVATSRNDNHGGSLLYRMQCFVDGFIEQCKRHDLRAELILVEWNPPEDHPPFQEALQIPQDRGPWEIRIIKVPKKIHDTLDLSETIPLFQMLGKNVGIRRARGQFVLATNIDILFSDPLFTYFKNKKLRSKVLYRVDRLDIPPELPKVDAFEKVLNHCKHSYFRIHKRGKSKIKENNKWKRVKEKPTRRSHNPMNILKKIFRANGLIKILLNELTPIYHAFRNDLCSLFILKTPHSKRLIKGLKLLFIFPVYFLILTEKLLRLSLEIVKYPTRILLGILRNLKPNLTKKRKLKRFLIKTHTNACGDFTLLSLKDWELLRGYPEWSTFSWHLDSIFLYQALLGSIKQKNFAAKMPIYHIEHGIGSGYTPEGQELLFARLKNSGVNYIDNSKLKELIQELWVKRKDKNPHIYNESDWGLANHQLEDIIL